MIRILFKYVLNQSSFCIYIISQSFSPYLFPTRTFSDNFNKLSTMDYGIQVDFEQNCNSYCYCWCYSINKCQKNAYLYKLCIPPLHPETSRRRDHPTSDLWDSTPSLHFHRCSTLLALHLYEDFRYNGRCDSSSSSIDHLIMTRNDFQPKTCL